MFATAEQEPIPKRFDATPHLDSPAMVLTDAESGRGTVVPLFAYRAVRKVLHDLFGDHPG